MGTILLKVEASLYTKCDTVCKKMKPNFLQSVSALTKLQIVLRIVRHVPLQLIFLAGEKFMNEKLIDIDRKVG